MRTGDAVLEAQNAMRVKWPRSDGGGAEIGAAKEGAKPFQIDAAEEIPGKRDRQMEIVDGDLAAAPGLLVGSAGSMRSNTSMPSAMARR